ncbi:ATP-binding protein [Rossellomorea marisflavi]|nr:ATP-binding protein [Rossellomorea marisflavi]USK91998.1 PAS domain-containing protein [Rossellomorea marisflavi]
MRSYDISYIIMRLVLSAVLFLSAMIMVFVLEGVALLIAIPVVASIGLSLLYQSIKKALTFSSVHETLLEEENQLSTLLHSLPDFVSFKDGEGRWMKVNQFGRELYNLEGIDYIGKTDRELGELVPFFKDAFDFCIESDERAWGEKGTRCEESFVLPSGEHKTFDVIKVPLFHSSGERKGLVIIGRDITQQKVAEEMLLRNEKLSVVGELAAGIAHEIRNPLTSIKGFIQLLEENEHVSDRYLTIMSTEMDRINQIVGELLILSKPHLRESRPFDIREVLDYVGKVMGHEALMKGINLKVDLPQEPVEIVGDRNQCIQVVINITKNAIESMEEGLITIKAHCLEEEILITVQDQGAGIPADRLERLGEPFFTLKEKGMGLGLTISQKIIEGHKGSLKIESELGEGTRVTIGFPIHARLPSAP